METMKRLYRVVDPNEGFDPLTIEAYDAEAAARAWLKIAWADDLQPGDYLDIEVTDSDGVVVRFSVGVEMVPSFHVYERAGGEG